MAYKKRKDRHIAKNQANLLCWGTVGGWRVKEWIAFPNHRLLHYRCSHAANGCQVWSLLLLFCQLCHNSRCPWKCPPNKSNHFSNSLKDQYKKVVIVTTPGRLLGGWVETVRKFLSGRRQTQRMTLKLQLWFSGPTNLPWSVPHPWIVKLWGAAPGPWRCPAWSGGRAGRSGQHLRNRSCRFRRISWQGCSNGVAEMGTFTGYQTHSITTFLSWRMNITYLRWGQ